jgi:alpha-galactosidase
VQDWATEWIGALVEECGIRWLKWDSNYWGICTSPNHDHPVGDAEAHQIEGVQIVLARLNERFPDLVIENCAGGATRMDFALARHTPAAWLNDASEPAHRSRFHNAGASYLFPPEMLNAWITESEHENVNTQDLPDDVWRMVIRSRMLGAIGFSCRLTTWSDRTLDIAREEVMRYREALRPHLRHGSFRHLLPQPVIESARLPTPETWEAYQVSAADRSEHIILGFRNMTTANTQVVHPHLIDPAATYTVLADTAAPEQRTGESLLREGITLTCPLLTSTWITIRRTNAGDAA